MYIYIYIYTYIYIIYIYIYIYIKSKQVSMNNVLPIEINNIFEIYSSSADRREDTGHHTR